MFQKNKASQTASSRHFRSALRAGVSCGDVTALSCFIFDPMCHPHFQVKTTLWDGPWNSSNVADLYMGFRSHLALDDPHRPQRILPSQTLLKNGPTGLVWKQGLYFLTLPAKTHTSLHRRDNGVIWLCQQLIFRIFSGYIPLVLFFVYAAQFLHRAIFPSSTLITFCRTLLEY